MSIAPGTALVRIHDPSADAPAGVTELAPRDAAAVILALQAEAGEARMDLARLAVAVDGLLKAIGAIEDAAGTITPAEAYAELVTRLKAVRNTVTVDVDNADLDRRTGYPRMDSIASILDLAYDSEGYREHVGSHTPSAQVANPDAVVDEAVDRVRCCIEEDTDLSNLLWDDVRVLLAVAAGEDLPDLGPTT